MKYYSLKRLAALALLLCCWGCSKKSALQFPVHHKSLAGQTLTDQLSSSEAIDTFSTHINNAKELVQTFNQATTSEAKQNLVPLFIAYIAWFKALHIEQTLRQEKLLACLQEYKLLACLQPASPAHQELLRDYFYSLYDKILKEATGNRERPLMKTLVYVLQNIDRTIFQAQDADPLIELINCLLTQVDPTSTNFTAATYVSHAPVLEAIYHTLAILQEVDSNKWSAVQAGGLYQHFQQQLVSMAENTQYYPVQYHAHLLGQSIAQFEQEETVSGLSRLTAGLKGIYAIYCGISAFQGLDLAISLVSLPDLETLKEAFEPFKAAYDHFQLAFHRAPSDQISWYEWHQALYLSSTLCLQLPDKATAYYEDFTNHLNKLTSHLQVQSGKQKKNSSPAT